MQYYSHNKTEHHKDITKSSKREVNSNCLCGYKVEVGLMHFS